MRYQSEWRVCVSEAGTTGKIDRTHDDKRLRAGAFRSIPYASDFLNPPDTSQM
jgi:hypothetical protein